MATVADAERKGILLSLESLSQHSTIALLSDSQAAIQTVVNLAKGNPPRSGIELQIKRQLQERLDRNMDTAISWVRAHVQIPGNEEADALANWASHLGETRGSTKTVTEGGLRAKGKRERAIARKQPGFRLGSATEWNRQACSAYTWMRTNKGPQKQWLHRIGRADDPYCPCHHETIQSAEHITFACQLHARARRTLIGERQSWEDLGVPRWIETGPNERMDGVEEFFSYLFHQLTGQ